MKYNLHYILASLLALVVAACSQTTRPHKGLTAEGLLALSSSNPYLGANQYLSGEMERSTVLFRFLENRGGPQAIRVDESLFSDTSLYLFYPAEREYFIGEIDEDTRSENSDVSNDWVIRGPYALNRHDFRALRQMEHDPDEPVFVLYGEKIRFSRNQSLSEERTHVVASIPKPRPKPKKKVRITKKSDPKKKASPAPVDLSKMNRDQLAIAMSKGYAERALNGDLIHTVRYGGETIGAITKWYTGDTTNTGKITSINDLKEPISLKQHDRIVIPSNLVKNVKVMPSDYYVE